MPGYRRLTLIVECKLTVLQQIRAEIQSITQVCVKMHLILSNLTMELQLHRNNSELDLDARRRSRKSRNHTKRERQTLIDTLIVEFVQSISR